MTNQDARENVKNTNSLVFTRSPNAIFSEVDGEFVALNIDKGQCYGMDNVCSAVWNLLELPHSLDELCAKLQGDYDVDADDCRRDVAELIESLLDEDLIVAGRQALS